MINFKQKFAWLVFQSPKLEVGIPNIIVSIAITIVLIVGFIKKFLNFILRAPDSDIL